MLILYGTQGCHLCDDAEALLQRATGHVGPGTQPRDPSPGALHESLYEKVDIANDDVLFTRYGWHIPVLRCDQSDRELRWPFDLPQLEQFLRDLSRDNGERVTED